MERPIAQALGARISDLLDEFKVDGETRVMVLLSCCYGEAALQGMTMHQLADRAARSWESTRHAIEQYKRAEQSIKKH